MIGSEGGAFGGGLDGENRDLKSIFVDLKQAQRSVPTVACEDGPMHVEGSGVCPDIRTTVP